MEVENVAEMDAKVNNPKDNPRDNTKTPLKYDPAKKYKWEPGTNFFLSGEEFGVTLNSLRAILNTPEAQRILLAERASIAVENALSRAIEMGFVQEDTLPPMKK